MLVDEGDYVLIESPTFSGTIDGVSIFFPVIGHEMSEADYLPLHVARAICLNKNIVYEVE